ncbi:MAG: hypothetical protein DF168_02068 [Candidatus Moanabacter tarae]|uniref:DUF2062 domain-containing protein n=1 Tax=Candidatus Moanibacter tarae TaxID=2200854 RepID=A0A2Z4AK52_9BACT|nr:MAG: hypothetical protein DF168_02068 [Candidatus Moanabacter tarae]
MTDDFSNFDVDILEKLNILRCEILSSLNDQMIKAMPPEFTNLKEKHFSRIRRVKRLLRPLPRRANLHRYPFIKWFAKTARNRSFLWSFRTTHVVPSLYAGCILAFMPLYGAQVPLALVTALVIRCNLPILVGLQFLSNPLTLPIIYLSAYGIGDFLLGIFGDSNSMIAFWGTDGEKTLLMESVYTVTATVVGGIIIGYFAGVLSSVVYRIAVYRAAKTFHPPSEFRKAAAAPMKNPSDL